MRAPIFRRWGGMPILGAALLAVSGAEARAECAQWTMDPGTLAVKQSNGFTIELAFSHGIHEVQGRYPFVFGNARYTAGGRRVEGTLIGTVDRNRFSVEVQWENGTRGLYRGDITPDGDIVNGRSSDVQNPDAPAATWHLERGRLRCMRPRNHPLGP